MAGVMGTQSGRGAIAGVQHILPLQSAQDPTPGNGTTKFRVALPLQSSFSEYILTDTPKEVSSHGDSKSTQVDRISVTKGCLAVLGLAPRALYLLALS